MVHVRRKEEEQENLGSSDDEERMMKAAHRKYKEFEETHSELLDPSRYRTNLLRTVMVHLPWLKLPPKSQHTYLLKLPHL